MTELHRILSSLFTLLNFYRSKGGSIYPSDTPEGIWLPLPLYRNLSEIRNEESKAPTSEDAFPKRKRKEIDGSQTVGGYKKSY